MSRFFHTDVQVTESEGQETAVSTQTGVDEEPIASTEAQVNKTTEENIITSSTEVILTEVEVTTNATENSQVTTQGDTQHVHNFVASITYIYHAEEGHYEEVCVSQGYEKKIYETYDTYCYQCGAIMDDWGFNELLDHSALHGSYGSYTAVIDTIWHEPVYENRWIVDKEAYKEEVYEEKCIECGYVK